MTRSILWACLLKAISAACLFAAAMTAAQADWRSELGTFRLTILSQTESRFFLPRMEPLRLALQDQLGVPVEIRPDASLERFILNQSDRPSEYLVVPASVYAAIWLRCECIEPLAIAQTAGGETAIRGVLITRASTALAQPGDLAGRQVFGLSPSSLAGFAMADAAIRGAASDRAADWRFEDAAEQVLIRFAAGEGDAIAGWAPAGVAPQEAVTGTFARLVQLGMDPASLRVIWQSGELPNRVHAVRKNLDGEAKRLLRDYLTGLSQDDPLVYDVLEPDHAGGLSVARQSQFDDLIAFLSADTAQNEADGPSEDDPGPAGSETTAPAE